MNSTIDFIKILIEEFSDVLDDRVIHGRNSTDVAGTTGAGDRTTTVVATNNSSNNNSRSTSKATTPLTDNQEYLRIHEIKFLLKK